MIGYASSTARFSRQWRARHDTREIYIQTVILFDNLVDDDLAKREARKNEQPTWTIIITIILVIVVIIPQRCCNGQVQFQIIIRNTR